MLENLILQQPKYKTTLPISCIEVEYRPYLVKEEKIVLLALSTDSFSEMKNAIRQIISNCTFEKVDIENISALDVSYLIIKIKGASKGDKVSLAMKCKNIVPNEFLKLEGHENEPKTRSCDHVTEFVVDLNTLGLDKAPDDLPDNKIDLGNGMGLLLRYPNLDVMDVLDSNNEITDHDLSVDAIDAIYDSDQVYNVRDISKEELEAFLDQLTDVQFKEIGNFIKNMPKIKVDVDFDCEVCGHSEKIYVTDLNNFFG